ncbi:hypothetical protein ILUMI_21670 [Ignelater luminosus]|uniref:HTH psq-type domain-containing protein n=1 Tax=Ignelater luminosus TaxID=2038154 RepID=A0A8K0CF76_IGNLU|nr:hypothetical protein ILUMI_21670 [Ignelater luminosus]
MANRPCRMPRNYIRKTETKYKLEDLQKAVEDVKTKRLTIGKAAETYSVPKTTIFNHLKKAVIKQPRTGRKSLFTDEQELELTDTRPPNVGENDIHTNQMVIYDQQAPDAHNHSSDISTVAKVHSAKTFDIQASDTIN